LIKRSVSPFNVNSVSLACVPEALADPLFIETCVAEIRESRSLLEGALRELGITFVPSSANFVLAFLGERRASVVNALAAQGIYVREREIEGGDGAVRISLGSRLQTQRVIDCLRTVLKDAVAGVSA
jgi:histidinol-phosphate aminotransferase